VADQRGGGIPWTEDTWNPIRGCSRVSLGCGGPHGQGGCYAERLAIRLSGPGQPYEGLVKSTPSGPRWTGRVALVESALDLPLRWKKPGRIFVNSMSDLFHEKVPDEWIDRIFAVMAKAPQHTFQILTKRPERMLEWVTRSRPVPLPNVWLGVSVEDQETADVRIPLLLQTPTAVRWVSYEPALGSVDFRSLGLLKRTGAGLDWMVVGGESGPGARPFDLAWARQTIDQCREAGIAPFFKQTGSRPILDGEPLRLKDRKGGDMDEWPADLRVREYPRSTVKPMAEAER
jgi:protein gp37